jgi:hypothetical protein
MKPVRMNALTLIAVLLVATQVAVACAPAVAAAPVQPPAAAPAATMTMAMPAPTTTTNASGIDPLVFQQNVRKLWEDHITWTRVYIISAVAGLPETDTAAARLLDNQTAIGDAIKPFYGDAAGEQLTSLLRDHILTAAELLAAAKAGDNAKVQAASSKWYDNANQIAAFLSSANPKAWPLTNMQSMMKTHLDLTLAEATARLQQDWPADIAAYDNVHDEILQMADMLSAGIVAQFPDKFTPQQASPQAIALTLAMNKLWEVHVTWTRTYLMSATSNLPDVDAAAGRLLQNQVDIGNAIKPVYGDAAGTQLSALLKDHILTAAELVAAAKSGDSAKVQAASTKWYDNADQIAVLLNSANPDQWPLADLKSMMKTHLDLTLAEATARLKGHWTDDVAAYDKVHDEILSMSGMLTEGILAQYPDKFQ